MSFRKIFGSSTAKILDHLIENKESDFSMTEIARESGISYRTIQREFPKLIELDFVRMTRKIGRAELYKINLENEVLRQLASSLFELEEKQEYHIAYR